MQTSSKLVRNSIANYWGTLVTLAVGFLLTPFLVHSLGNTGYGAWILVGSISSYFWLLDFGLSASVTKFVSEFHATLNHDRLNSVVVSSCALLSIVGIISLAGSWGAAHMVDSLFKLPEAIVPEVKTMIYITGIALAVSFPLGVFGGVLRGYQRYDLINLVGVISTISNAVFSVVVVKLGLGLAGLAAVGLLTNLIVGGGRLVLAKRVDPGLILRPSMASLSTLREITGFSVWVFVINVAVQVVYRTSPIIIASILSVALVTPYSLASSLVQYAKRFVDPILAVLLPAYAEMSALDDQERIRHLFTEGSRIVGAMAMPLALGLTLLGKPFIALWVGPRYAQSGDLLYFLVPPLYLSFLISMGDQLLWAKGKIKVNSYVAVADTVLNLSLSIGLALTMGLAGVALATLLSVLITNGLVLLPYICREAGISMRSYLIQVAKPITLPAIPAAGLVLILMRLIEVNGYLQFLFMAAVCATTYWGLFIVLSTRGDRDRWLSLLRTAVLLPRTRSLRSQP